MPKSGTRRYDCIIIGGGPAGATAAHTLGSRGNTVLLIDKAEFPRKKLCGGLITWKTVQLLEREFGISLTELQAQDYIDFSTPEYEVFFEGGTVKQGQSDRPYHFADRQRYDNYLFQAATSLDSVDSIEGEAVHDIDIKETSVQVATDTRYTASYIIGADGVNSIVREALINRTNFDVNNWSENLAIATEAFIPRDEIALSTDSLLVHLGFVEWGYGWVFPNQDQYVIGVGGLNRKNDTSFRTLQNNYYDELGIDADAARAEGHPIPFGNFLADPTAQNVMLVGDAGGYVDAMSGEGIFYGMRSGELCGHAIDTGLRTDTDAAAQYRSHLESYVLPELRLSKLVRPLLWGGPNRLRRPLIHTWGAALHKQWEELVHGTRLYKLLRRRGDPYHLTTP